MEVVRLGVRTVALPLLFLNMLLAWGLELIGLRAASIAVKNTTRRACAWVLEI